MSRTICERPIAEACPNATVAGSTNSTETPIEFVRPAQVWRELSISAATGWRWVDSKLLPQPVKIGPHSTAFIRSEVERAKAALINARTAA